MQAVIAWTVGLHNTPLGTAHPDCVGPQLPSAIRC